MILTPYVFAALLAAGGSVQQYTLENQIRASQQLHVGDTEQRVHELLGKPNLIWEHDHGIFSSGSGPRRWIYGTDIDLKGIINSEWPFPNPISFRLRLFSPDQDDLVITWDDGGKVASIERPATNNSNPTSGSLPSAGRVGEGG